MSAAPDVTFWRCWFCHRPTSIDRLIAGYDTWTEMRLACLPCDRRMRAGLPPRDPDPLWAGEDGYLIVEESEAPAPGFLRRLVAAVAAWWRR